MKPPQKISVNQFADTYRNQYSGWDHMSDIELAEFVSKKNPNVRNIIDFTQAEPSKEFKETYDPGVWDHMKQSWFNLKSMGVEIPSFAIAQAVRFVDDEPEMRKKVEGWAEDARGWGKNKVDEWMNEDKGIQGYLEWQTDVPMGLNNFYHGDMMARGLANLAPSIATMVGTSAVSGGALGVLGAGAKILKYGRAATQLLTGFALEGSSEYNEAMGYLVDDPDGPQLSPSEAMDTANSTALAYGLVSGAIEAFQIGKVSRVLGMGDEPFKKIWTKRIANTLQKAKEKGNVRTIAELGGNVLKDSFIQGLQEGSQQTSQILIGNIYRKYGGDPDKAFQNFNADLQEAMGTAETKESFFSAAAANLLMGGTAGSARFAGRRYLKRIKDREDTRLLEEDTYEYPEGVIGEGRSGGAMAGMAFIQDVEATNPTVEEKEQMDSMFVGEDSISIEENKANFFTALKDNPAVLDEINPNLSPDEWFNLLDPNNEDNNSIATVEEAEAVRQIAINLRKPPPSTTKKVKKKKVIPKKVKKGTVDQEVANWATSFEQEMDRPPTEEEIDNYRSIVTPEPDISEDPEVVMNTSLQTYPKLTQEQADKELEKINADLKAGKNVKANEIRKDIIQDYTTPKTEVKTKAPKEKVVDIKVDKKGREVTYFSKTTEKDGVKTTKFTFNRSDKKASQRNKAEVSVEAALGDKFEVDETSIPEGDIVTKVFETREGKTGTSASVEFTTENGLKYRGEVLLKKKDPLSIVKQKGEIADKDKFSEKIDKIIDPNNEKQLGFDIDYQRPQQSPKAKDNKELSNAMEKRLKKQFPWIKASWVEKVLDTEGVEVAGRAFKNIVEWSKGKATLDTIPHEYAHIYIKLMKGHPVIQEGLKRFGGEEKLVQRMGEYYTNRMADKGLYSRFKTWLRKFHIALKQFFGSTLSDKQLSDAIGEKFFGAKIKDTPKKISRKVEFQRKTSIVQNLKNVNAVKAAEKKGEGINVLRKKGNQHYGNPFSSKYFKGTERHKKTVAEAVKAYKDWLWGSDYQNIESERRDWILSQISKGVLDGQTLLYYTDALAKKGQQSHADALVEFVNETYERRSPKKVATLQERMTEKIEVAISPGAKAAGHLPKEQVKTERATQFIGDGSKNSSSDRYRKMYEGEGLANTGDYKETDVIFIASNGKRGNRVKPVKNGVLQGAYKNVDLAIKAGATIMMDTYDHLVRTKDYNLGEIELAKYVKSKGYKRLDRTGEWVPAKGKVRRPTSTTPSGIKVFRKAFRDLDYSKLKDIIKNTGQQTYGWFAAWYGDVEYTYGPGKGISHSIQKMPEEFRIIANRIEDATGVPRGYYNSALVNLFPPGKGITAHADDEQIFMRANDTIGKVATVSLGGSTEITISGAASEKITVNAGDVYIMPGQSFQLNHKHAVGPSNQERVSLTFRHIPDTKQDANQVNASVLRTIKDAYKKLSKKDFDALIIDKVEKFGKVWENVYRAWAVSQGQDDIVAKIDESNRRPEPKNVDNNPVPTDEHVGTDGEIANNEENVHPTTEDEQVIVNSDVRKSVDQIISQALKVIGAGLLENSTVLRNLVMDAKKMDFEVWLNTSLKAHTGKDLSNWDKKYAKSKEDAERQLLKLWTSVNSQGKVNSKSWFDEMYHNMHLVIKQVWDGKTYEKGRKLTRPVIVNMNKHFRKVEGTLEKWFGGKNPKKSKAKQFATKYIAMNVEAVSELLKNSYLITGENFYQSEQTAISEDNLFPVTTNPSKPYGFLGVKEMDLIMTEDAKRYENNVATGGNPVPRKVPVITRGEGEALLLAEVTDEIRKNAKNHIAYWQKQFDAGFITKDQFKSLKAMSPKMEELGNSNWGLINIENEIATFEFLNTLYPGYMKDSWANVLKRIKIPLTPANSSERMGDSKAYFVDSGKLGYSPPGSNEIISGKQIITDVAKKGNEKHIGDGNIPTSASYFKRISAALGLDPNAGFAKTIIYDSELGDNFDESKTLMIKAQQHRADPGVTYYNDGVPFARVDENGDIIPLNSEGKEDYKAPVIDMIMTEDERKIGKGKGYGVEGEFTIPGTSIGLIKYPEKSKTKTKFPHQWLNYLPEDMQKKITDHYMKAGSPIRKLVDNVFKNSKDPEAMKKLVRSIEKLYPGETPGVINNFVDLGSGKHPASATQLAKMIVSKYLIPAMSMDGQRGTTSYLAPNYYNDLAASETAMSVYNAMPIIKMYNFAKNTKLEPENITPEILNDINEWIKGQGFKVLVTRSPVPHLNGVVYLNVKRLHLKKDVVEFHKEITFRLLEGDYDGDSVAIEFPESEIAEVYEEFFNSDLYVKSIEGVDLEDYKEAKNVDMTDFRQRYEIMEEMGVGQRSISQIATTQAIFNSIRKTINDVTIEANNELYIIQPNEGDIQLGNIPGEKGLMSVDKALRRYLQAATDNAKFLLLSSWGYDITNLRQRLFTVTIPGKGKMTFAEALTGAKMNLEAMESMLNAKDLTEDEFKQINKKIGEARGQLGLLNAIWSRFDANVWNLHKAPYSMRKGNNGASGKLLLEDYIKLGKGYSFYLKDRSGYIMRRQYSQAVLNSLPDYKAEKYQEVAGKYGVSIVNVDHKNHQTPMEYIAAQIAEEQMKYGELPGQTSPIEFDNSTVEGAHWNSYEEVHNVFIDKIIPNLAETDSKDKAHEYAKSLIGAIFKAVGSNNRIQPQSWMQNEDLVKVVEDFTKKFNNLTENEKKIATGSYLYQLGTYRHGGYKKLSKKAIAEGGVENNMLRRLELFAPVASKEGFNLLHDKVAVFYFKKFNEGLKLKEDKALNREMKRMTDIGKC